MSRAAGSMRIAAALVAVVLGGCATAPPGGAAGATPDPWENWNRKVFAFNESVDRAVLKPVAQTYRDQVPKIIRTSVDNVLGNIHDVWSTANHFLQGKFRSGLEMGMRVLTNTILGVGGVLDPATEIGLTRRSEDFGQTLGRWGLASGPYVVLPIVGPSTVRDTAGFLVDRLTSPSALPETSTGRYVVLGVEIIDTRSNLLATGALIDQVALDKYDFIRDAYIAQRRDALYDGAPPMDTFEDDGADVKPAAAAASAPAASAAAPAAAASAARAASAPR